MAEQRRVIVSDKVWALLEQVSRTGLYGPSASGTGARIIKNEPNHLIVSGELDKLLARMAALGAAAKDPIAGNSGHVNCLLALGLRSFATSYLYVRRLSLICEANIRTLLVRNLERSPIVVAKSNSAKYRAAVL
jgi:hypothetical protein